MLFIIEIPMLILIEQVLKQYWYVSRCANNELAPCILKLKNNTEWKQTTVTEITENRFGNFRFWGENMLDRFGFFSFSSPGINIIVGIMHQCDHQINFSSMCRSVTYILWPSKFASCLENYLFQESCTWDDRSVSLRD